MSDDILAHVAGYQGRAAKPEPDPYALLREARDAIRPVVLTDHVLFPARDGARLVNVLARINGALAGREAP